VAADVKPFRGLGSAPRHHLVDPAFAARLLGVEAGALLDAGPQRPLTPRGGTLLGQLFEALVTLDGRVYAQAAEARIGHLRTHGGEHEVDLIIERGDHRVLAVEVKLAHSVRDGDLRHLRWLQDQLGDRVLDAIVVNRVRRLPTTRRHRRRPGSTARTVMNAHRHWTRSRLRDSPIAHPPGRASSTG